MHKKACAVIRHKNLAEFKMPFSTKCHVPVESYNLKKTYRSENIFLNTPN